jgi:hypothetical protein
MFIAASLLRVNYKTGHNLHTHARHSPLHNCKHSGGWHPALPAGLRGAPIHFLKYIYLHMQHSITSDREAEIGRQREEASWQFTVGMIFVWKWPHHRISIVRSFSIGVAFIGSACMYYTVHMTLSNVAESNRAREVKGTQTYKPV